MVPEDLQVGLFHSKAFSELGVTLPTAVLPFQEMGYHAVKMMEMKLKDPSGRLPFLKLPCELHKQEIVQN